MRNLVKNYKKEFFYITVIFVLLQLSLISEFSSYHSFWILNIAGLAILIVWMVTNYFEHAYKEISKYSEVLKRIDLKNRFFSFFITPTLLYLAVSFYLYGVTNIILRQIVLIVGVLTLYILMLNIRASYEKIFTLERRTRFAFQLADVVLFYIGVTGFVLIGTTDIMRVLGSTVIGFILLLHQLILNKQDSVYAFVILLLSTILLFVSGLFFVQFGAVIYPLYMSVMFYLVLSLWNVRLHGIMKISEYLPPILFSLMAFMILFSF